jgi:hypothetical protein
MSTIAVNAITDASGGNTASINGATPTTDNTMGRNRIQNGDMRIDQRNAGAAITTSGYLVDRWNVTNASDAAFSAQQDASVPAGFTKSLKFTTTTADASLASSQYAIVRQGIEGYNIADLSWGTANAKSITISFWVRSSLTGTFGGAMHNVNFDRSFAFTYSISLADTWEYKSVTIAGDTTGTWNTSNSVGIQLYFGLGVGTDLSVSAGSWAAGGYLSATGATSVIGTLNATFYITGVQLEAGSVATSFERRPYGQELALCQRYYFDAKLNLSSPQKIIWGAPILSTTSGSLRTNVYYPVTMRADPTITVAGSSTGTFISGAPYANYPTPENAHIILDTTAAGNYAYIYSFIASAEL